MPIYGLVITLSDAELSTQQSERVLPALASAFGTDAITEVATWGRYHMWRLTHTIEAPTMLEAAEGTIRMAREARDAAGIHPGQAVGFSSQLRDLSHLTSSSFRWGRRVRDQGLSEDQPPTLELTPSNRDAVHRDRAGALGGECSREPAGVGLQGVGRVSVA
jgi:hypothetical protein